MLFSAIDLNPGYKFAVLQKLYLFLVSRRLISNVKKFHFVSLIRIIIIFTPH